MNKKLLIILTPLFLLFTSCSDSDNISNALDDDNGGTSIEVVGVIKGRTVYEGGIAASHSLLKLTSLYTLDENNPSNTISQIESGDNGNFTMPIYNTGTFGFIASDKNGKGVYKNIDIDGVDSIIDLEDILLESNGSLEVNISFADSINSINIFYLHIIGYSHFNEIHRDSIFNLDSIPPGRYTIQISPMYMTQYQFFAIKDTVIEILPNTTTKIKNLKVPQRKDIEKTADYVRDTLAVRAILDSNDINAPVANVTGVLNNRIVHLAFMFLDIKTLTSEITELDQLQWLYLQGHQMKKIPSYIGELENLIRIKVSTGPLELLPEELVNLTKLRFAEFESCELQEIPEVLTEILSLHRIYLQGNKISSLNNIRKFKNIGSKLLDLNNNKIINISDSDKSWMIENVFDGNTDDYAAFAESQKAY